MPQARRCRSWQARSSSAPRTSRIVTVTFCACASGAALVIDGSLSVYTVPVVFGTSVSKWLVLAALVALLWVARGVLPPFIVAGILAYVLSPLVDELAARTGWRRAWVALLVFAAVVAIVAVLVWVAGARLGAELRALSREGPGIIQSVVDHLTGGQPIEMVRVGFELILAIVLVFLSLAYMLIDGQNFFLYVLRFVPVEHRLHVQ